MKYRVINITIKRDGKKFREGDLIDLPSSEAEKLSQYLEAVEEKKEAPKTQPKKKVNTNNSKGE